MARILVVDDEEQLRAVLRTMLERDGHEVEEAQNGVVAMQSLREGPADLMILDILMPEKEGIETIQEVRAEHPGVKIIAISGGGADRAEELS